MCTGSNKFNYKQFLEYNRSVEVNLAFRVPNLPGFYKYYPISLSYPFKLIAFERRHPSFVVHSPPSDFCAADCRSASMQRGPWGRAVWGAQNIFYNVHGCQSLHYFSKNSVCVLIIHCLSSGTLFLSNVTCCVVTMTVPN